MKFGYSKFTPYFYSVKYYGLNIFNQQMNSRNSF